MANAPVIQIPKVFEVILLLAFRYFVFYGGRGAAKSHTIARILLILGMQSTYRIACCREVMTSISDSVHRLLKDLIGEYGLHEFYTVYNDRIEGKNGTLFIFKGLKHNVSGIKSLEGVDIAWIEEAENVTDGSWEILIPTIRKPGSCIIVSFNTRYSSDPTYQRFVANPSSDTYVAKVSFRDNPFFPEVLEKERVKLMMTDHEAYLHVWEGEPDTRRTGFIYAKQITKAREEGRIGKFPYDPGFPVYTAWDLGFGDATSIFFFQVIGREVRIIDHFSNCGEELDYYVREVLNKKPYTYARVSVYLPHDGAHGNIRGARPSQQLADMGYKNIVLPRASGISADIEMTRQVLNYCNFHKEACHEGIHSLEHYRYQWDDNRKIFKKTPLHDWSSNDADAMRYVAQAVSQLKHIPVATSDKSDPFRRRNSASSWMGA